jgi:hypothetical protein
MTSDKRNTKLIEVEETAQLIQNGYTRILTKDYYPNTDKQVIGTLNGGRNAVVYENGDEVDFKICSYALNTTRLYNGVITDPALKQRLERKFMGETVIVKDKEIVLPRTALDYFNSTFIDSTGYVGKIHKAQGGGKHDSNIYNIVLTPNTCTGDHSEAINVRLDIAKECYKQFKDQPFELYIVGLITNMTEQKSDTNGKAVDITLGHFTIWAKALTKGYNTKEYKGSNPIILKAPNTPDVTPKVKALENLVTGYEVAIAESAEVIETLENEVTELHQVIKTKDMVIASRDAEIAELRALLAKKDLEINNLLNSSSSTTTTVLPELTVEEAAITIELPDTIDSKSVTPTTNIVVETDEPATNIKLPDEEINVPINTTASEKEEIVDTYYIMADISPKQTQKIAKELDAYGLTRVTRPNYAQHIVDQNNYEQVLKDLKPTTK